ncbi:hypothetical protein ACN47E_001988 [Coniothyrium glycines]
MRTALAVQSWALYGIGVSLIFSRIIFRRITLGCFKKLQADDWLMVFILIPYTASIAIANQISSEDSTQNRKFRYVLEELQLVVSWLVKTCLLILYWRIFPSETQRWKRRTLYALSALLAFSFLIAQISLLVTCQPTSAHWDMSTKNTQCTSYHTHTAITLPCSILTTLFLLLLPIPFIPTPRLLLQLSLLALGALTLTASLVARIRILTTAPAPTAPSPSRTLHWSTAELSLGVVFANLPFLTSLVVATAPARIRQFSACHRGMAPWPRSRAGSVERSSASASASAGRASVGASVDDDDEEKGAVVRAYQTRFTERPGSAGARGSCTVLRRGAESLHDDEEEGKGEVVVPLRVSASPERVSVVPKTRLSGGLAEMGDVSVDNTEGWPIYWR